MPVCDLKIGLSNTPFNTKKIILSILLVYFGYPKL
jgi:hypothetical protein